MFRLTPDFILSTLIMLMLSLFSHAELEQKLVTINDDDKKVTLTLFHFNSSVNKVSILPVSKNVGLTIGKLNAKAAISIPQESGITALAGKLVFGHTTKYILNAGTPVANNTNDAFSKHTFVLTDGKGSFSLGYAPLTSVKELTYAIQKYTKSNKINYHTAILLNSGNSSSFYKTNGDYHPYYLKELNPAKQILMVK